MSEIKWVVNGIASADLTSSASTFDYTYQPAVMGENPEMMIIRQITVTLAPSVSVAATTGIVYSFYLSCDINHQNIGYISIPYQNNAANTTSQAINFNSNPNTHIYVGNKTISNSIRFALTPVSTNAVPTTYSIAVVFDLVKYI